MKYIIVIFSFFLVLNSFAQKPNTEDFQGANFSFEVIGKVYEKETNTTMEYSTVSLYSQKDSSLVTGTITGISGLFTLTTKVPGNYFLKISYIGFETKTVNDIKLTPKTPSFDAGKIYLGADAKQLNTIEVIGTKSAVRYEMDKKVVSVDKTLASESGTAVDVLETVPSVTVAVDGTVSLRGSSNFLVLVNGQPTQLQASEALQQIPANNIKNIEIITNPSAKFEAGNSAGILNIILKEEKLLGTSGMLSLNGGTFSSYGGSVNIKHNVNKFSFDFSAFLRSGIRPRTSTDSSYTSKTDNIYTVTSGDNSRGHTGFSFVYTMGYQIAKMHNLTLGMTYGRWGMNAENENISNRVNKTQNTSVFAKNLNDQKRGSPYYGPSLTYYGTLKNKTTISSFISFTERDFKENVNNIEYNELDEYSYGSISKEEGLGRRITSKIDVTIPIKTGKLEVGGQSENNWNEDVNEYYELDLGNNKYFETDYNNFTVATRDYVYGIYANYGNKYKKLSYAAGLRAEYTDRSIEILGKNIKFEYFKWNYFPTANLGYNFSDSHQIYASYSTRIERPRNWYLGPGFIKTGVNSFFQGNPELLPTIRNSVELGWNKTFKKDIRLSAELFYNFNNNITETVTTVQDDNSTLTKPYNIGNQQNIGLEMNLGVKPFKFWEFDLMGTVYYKILKGSFEDNIYDRNAFQWSARMNNYFNVTSTTKIQFSARYSSRELTALGFESYNLGFDLGLKQSFLKKALNITLNARNIFNTERSFGENISEDYFYSFTSKPKWPMINLAVSYRINNYKPQKSMGETEGEF